MQLSQQALGELKEVLQEEIKDKLKELSNEQINEFGMLLLSIVVYDIKRRVRQKVVVDHCDSR